MIAFVLAICGDVAQAQQAKRTFRLGYLSSFDPASESARSEGIWLALRELGYIEGQNIAIEYRYAEGNRDRFAELATELVRLKVDIMHGSSWGHYPGAKNATKTIPIVMAGPPADPVELGLVDSLARPGGNVTAFTSLSRDLAGNGWSCSKKPFPEFPVSRFSTSQPIDPANEVKEVLPVTAGALHLTIQPWEVPDVDGFEQAFATFKKERPDGLYVLSGTRMWAIYKRIAGFALKSQLPSIYNNTEAVDAGGLMFYGADVVDSYRRVATYVDRF